MNRLQNKYNVFRRLLKTSLYYCVKHRSFKSVAITLSLLDNKVVNSTIFKFLNTRRNILLYLLIYCLVRQRVRAIHEFTTLRNCWTFGTAFNRVQLMAQLMERASSLLRTGQRRTFMLIEWAVVEAVKQRSKFVECVFKLVNNSQSYPKFGTALSSRIGRAITTFFKFYVSHGNATR